MQHKYYWIFESRPNKYPSFGIEKPSKCWILAFATRPWSREKRTRSLLTRTKGELWSELENVPEFFQKWNGFNIIVVHARKVIPYEDYILGMSNILKEHYESERGTLIAQNAENEEMRKRYVDNILKWEMKYKIIKWTAWTLAMEIYLQNRKK